MYRRYKERRRYRRYDPDRSRRRWGLTSLFRSPRSQIAVLLVVAFIIFLILQSAGR